MAREGSTEPRERGTIERRGNSLRVRIYAGIDPLTGRRLYLSKRAKTEAEAKRILNLLRVEVAEQQNARTRATLETAMREWLVSHDVAENTKQGYEAYLRRYIGPAIGSVSLGKITAKVLEDFYAQLRRCRARCNGKPFTEHRADGPHECREVRHRRPPGRPTAKSRSEHDCERSGCTVIECQPHQCRPLAAQTIRQIHFAISSALSAAVRWEWIKSNPAAVTKKPRQPVPQPNPPTVDQAGRRIRPQWIRLAVSSRPPGIKTRTGARWSGW